MPTEGLQSDSKFSWTSSDSSLQLLQAANFASDFDDFCARILRGTYSYIGFEICILAKVVSHNVANCLGYCNLGDRVEQERKGERKAESRNLRKIDLNQDSFLKISTGEPHWQRPSLISVTGNSVSGFGATSHQNALVVPFPVFFREVGFLLLGTSNDKLTREVTRSEIDFLQWTVATYLLLAESRAEKQSAKTSDLGIFTIRQRKIYDHLLSGLTNIQIARMLNLSVSTIKAEITVIYFRLGVHRRSELRDNLEF